MFNWIIEAWNAAKDYLDAIDHAFDDYFDYEYDE